MDLFPLVPPLPKRLGQRLIWGQLHGSALGLALASAARTAIGPLVVVTEDTASGVRLAQDLRCYLGAERENDVEVLHFPDWETLPYDVFSPHQDIISDRLATLHRLPLLMRGVLFVPVATLMQRLPPGDYLTAGARLLEVGQLLNHTELRRQLEETGYHSVTTVLERGEFVERDGLMDLYSMGASLPCRIDLRDGKIRSIHTF